MSIAHLDFETFCDLDLRKVGAHRYARHPSCEVLIASYQLPGMADPAVWLPRTQAPPARLVAWVRGGGRVGAHNAAFERAVWRYALRRQYPSLPEVADTQWVCTAAKAAASGLPRSLERALSALKLDVEKDVEGGKLIKVFCSLRKPTKADPRTRILPEQDPRFQRFIRYCQQDVRGEVALHEALPDLIPRQQKMFVLDLVMNDRGLPVDLPLARKALKIVRELEVSIAARVSLLTGGLKATQVQKMLDFFSARGVELENMQAETIRQFAKNAKKLDPKSRELLELRIQAGKASTKKLVSILACADPEDHVVQGGFLIYGAHTGRYAGRLVQPQNFIRGLLTPRQRALVFELLDIGDAEVFKILYDQPIEVISQCMRGFIRAPRGYEFAIVDYTAIEARVLAWVAGEEGMLAAYRKGVDVYKLMAMRLFKIKCIEDVDEEQRRIAKNLVLGCGYQLGGVKFVDYCAKAGLIIDPDFAMAAVKTYRSGVPAIVESWKTVEWLVANAIRNPGKVYEGLKCKFFMRKHWLCIELPSGREVRYPYARAVPTERWGKPAWDISFWTEIKGRWLREKTYGGKLIENIVQAIAFDIMQEGMANAEAAMYYIFGTVHDELLTLRKKGTSSKEELVRLACSIRSWSKGIPLAAKAFICERYEKN